MDDGAHALTPVSVYPVRGIAGSAVNISAFAIKRVPVYGSPGESRDRTVPSTVVQIGTSATAVFPEDADRIGYVVVNKGASDAHVTVDGSIPTTSNGILLGANGGTIIVHGNDIRVYSPSQARGHWYDRSPSVTQQNGQSSAGAATLAQTTQWTFTCAAGKRALVDAVFAQVSNRANNAMNALAQGWVQFTTGSLAILVMAEASPGAGGVSVSQSIAGAGLLVASDAVRGIALSDNSAAGTDVYIRTAGKFTEFDA